MSGSELVLQSGAIPYAEARAQFRYLGMQITPWSGIKHSDMADHLGASFRRTKLLSLTPEQKLNLITIYLIPKYLHSLTIALLSINLLRELDGTIKNAVKEIYDLQPSTTNALLYCSKRNGGLPKLEVTVTAANLIAGQKNMNSEDPAIQLLVAGSNLATRLRKTSNAASLNKPLAESELQAYKRNTKKRELDRWASLGSQGKVVEAFKENRI